MLSKIWIWDPGSEIWDPVKTYSGSRGQKGTGSRIQIRNTAFERGLYLGELEPVGRVLVGIPGVHLHGNPVLPAQLLRLLPGRVRGRQQELNLDT